MKKLMIAAAIVCAAAFANAASMQWGTGGWCYSENAEKGVNTYEEGSAGSYWIVYLGTSSDVSGIGFDGKDVTGANVWTGSGATGTFESGDTCQGTIGDLDSTYNGKYFALVVYDDANELYGVSQAAMVNGIVDNPLQNADAVDFTNFYHEGDGANYMVANQAVPEPTSGLLLLLGVAGLALRRRRA